MESTCVADFCHSDKSPLHNTSVTRSVFGSLRFTCTSATPARTTCPNKRELPPPPTAQFAICHARSSEARLVAMQGPLHRHKHLHCAESSHRSAPHAAQRPVRVRPALTLLQTCAPIEEGLAAQACAVSCLRGCPPALLRPPSPQLGRNNARLCPARCRQA